LAKNGCGLAIEGLMGACLLKVLMALLLVSYHV